MQEVVTHVEVFTEVSIIKPFINDDVIVVAIVACNCHCSHHYTKCILSIICNYLSHLHSLIESGHR